MLDILNQPMHTWPEESKTALHMAIEKGAGDDINKHTRPIKILSALLRLRAKVLNRHLQGILSPKDFANRQFAAYKGASAVGLRRLLHTLLHVGLNRGRASVVFLDIAAAFDEVVQSVIQTVADRLPRGVGEVTGELLQFYRDLCTHVVTAFGLSAWYEQLGGGGAGGGGWTPCCMFWRPYPFKRTSNTPMGGSRHRGYRGHMWWAPWGS